MFYENGHTGLKKDFSTGANVRGWSAQRSAPVWNLRGGEKKSGESLKRELEDQTSRADDK